MKITRKQLRQLLEQEVKVVVMTDAQKQALEKEKEDVAAAKEKVANDMASSEDGVSAEDIKKAIAESLEKIGFYNKYSYGLDDIPNKTKAHDDIIGHTWLTHVKRKDSALNEIGKVLWHSLDESGHVAIYDVEWPECYVETNIPAILLEKVKDSDGLGEAHEAHGVGGHNLNDSIDQRRYKKPWGILCYVLCSNRLRKVV